MTTCKHKVTTPFILKNHLLFEYNLSQERSSFYIRSVKLYFKELDKSLHEFCIPSSVTFTYFHLLYLHFVYVLSVINFRRAVICQSVTESVINYLLFSRRLRSPPPLDLSVTTMTSSARKTLL